MITSGYIHIQISKVTRIIHLVADRIGKEIQGRRQDKMQIPRSTPSSESLPTCFQNLSKLCQQLGTNSSICGPMRGTSYSNEKLAQHLNI